MARLSKRSRDRLLQHHLILALVCTASLLALYASIQSPRDSFRWSMATAYLGLGLLGITLSIGPLNVLARRRNPISIDLRRDIGIWCGIVSLAHVIVGLQVHMGSMLLYFFNTTGTPPQWGPRLDVFGLTNYAGLASALLIVLLLTLSNDVSFRLLGRDRWKSWQRWNYAVAILVVLHAIAYQVLDRRQLVYLIVFGAIVLTTTVIQWRGFQQKRRQAGTTP